LDVLVADDDQDLAAALARLLADWGHRVTVAADGQVALAIIAERAFDLVICDVRMPRVGGLGVFRHLREVSPTTAVILMTGHGAVPEAVLALREGACDYLSKPVDVDAFSQHIERISERVGFRRKLDVARAELVSRSVGASIIGKSATIARLCQQIDTCAPSDAPVVITGEPGTGKSLVARTIHGQGPRRGYPLVEVSCADRSEEALAFELFGNEMGTATSTGAGSLGRFGAARNGTLVLEEIGELPRPTQVRLLQVLEQMRAGGLPDGPPEVRIIATTRHELSDQVASGRFLRELFLRLSVLELFIPPLRNRRNDLGALTDYFLAKLNVGGVAAPGFSPRAWSALTEYAYPGNVRELGAALAHAVSSLRGGEIDLADLPIEMGGRALASPATGS